MTLFLTSSPCDDNVPQGVSLPCIFDVSNGFVDRLRERVVPGCSCVIIAASPDAHALNDQMAWTFDRCFDYHGMTFCCTTLIDDRNPWDLPQAIAEAGVVILGGGHVPTQHAFLEQLGLRGLLDGFDGVVMGISAGSMNCCGSLYAQPEEPGEATDPHYRRFLQGLGLTDVMILPHYQRVKDTWLDGMRLIDDITCGDSHGREFWAIPDGSYVMQENGTALLCGEGYRIADGRKEQVTRCGDVLRIR